LRFVTYTAARACPNPTGKRFTIKVTPMQPLSAVVADVLGQLKLLDVRPEDCTLSLRGKALDLSTPVRFAAAGRDKLELKTGGAGMGWAVDTSWQSQHGHPVVEDALVSRAAADAPAPNCRP
jgi:hypothetical protein